MSNQQQIIVAKKDGKEYEFTFDQWIAIRNKEKEEGIIDGYVFHTVITRTLRSNQVIEKHHHNPPKKRVAAANKGLMAKKVIIVLKDVSDENLAEKVHEFGAQIVNIVQQRYDSFSLETRSLLLHSLRKSLNNFPQSQSLTNEDLNHKQRYE